MTRRIETVGVEAMELPVRDDLRASESLGCDGVGECGHGLMGGHGGALLPVILARGVVEIEDFCHIDHYFVGDYISC